MGKQGPCCHCGISTTPLWRNGPAEKPVLCNACGSRWRTKGTLVNYMPMHSGGLGLKSGSTKKGPGPQKINEYRSHKRKEPSYGFSELYFPYQGSDNNTSVVLEEDASTRSSTGSGISFSESCAQHTMTAGRGSECWPPWGCHVPSKRRTIMHRNRPSAKRFSCSLPLSDPFVCKYSPEEDLLVEYKPSSMTAEIGLGGVIIRPPVSRVPAQESQASSLMCDNKEVDHSVALKSDITREVSPGVHLLDRNTKHRGKEKTKQLARSTGAGCTNFVKSWMPNKTLLENFPYNKHDVLQSCHSPLVFVELKDIINSDTFMGLLTEQEQHQLVRHISPADALDDSLRCMFSSAQFESALRGFQALLSGGMFDSLESGLSPRVLQHYQQLLTLPDLTTSGWMERCSQILNRGRRKSSTDYAKIMQGKEYLKEKLKGLSALGADVLSSSADVVATKNMPASIFGSVTSEVQKTPFLSVPSSTCKAPISISSWSVLSDAAFQKNHQRDEPTSRHRRSSIKSDDVEGEGRNRPRSNAKSFYPLNKGRRSPANHCKSMEAPIYGVLEHDILLDLPSTLSFQQAELLQKPVWSKSSPRETGIDANQNNKNDDTHIQNIWPSETDLDWSGFLWNSPSTGSVNDTL